MFPEFRTKKITYINLPNVISQVLIPFIINHFVIPIIRATAPSLQDAVQNPAGGVMMAKHMYEMRYGARPSGLAVAAP